MEIRQMRTFKTVAETGSFSQTATLLGYTQSTVSAQMKQLTEEVGTDLYSYQKRQFTLTDAGARLLPAITTLLVDYAQVKTITDTKRLRGHLAIAAPESLTTHLLPGMITRFRQQHPDVTLQISNATCLHNEDKLMRGEVDIAFMMWPMTVNNHLVDYDLGLQDMVMVNGTERPYTSFFPDHNATFLTNEPECSYRTQFENSAWQLHQRKFPTVELDSIAAIKAMVASGLGFSYLPRETVEAELHNQYLYEIPSDVTNRIHAHLLYRKAEQQRELIQAFMQAADNQLQNA
ncbi:LysR family transcriptional regulator [Secundilactobacillus collinoides]|uniref:HTH lysR-type domain-containing protein n=2 Tax=Secundilactobacillus collinoides TaxID=33960 RepID=A0A0R2BBZ9_SECCO|nr:LysR family transcriptional regulator [Secundilactobacillus collinoides]KRM76877.1 hypothetical protein FC82_GL000981 [Secundilactobacillus collinoides DSM 20515 = JCM 1123]KZL36683.1 hypothetical protein TY91_13650 [Secundilactobacillus collinoides]